MRATPTHASNTPTSASLIERKNTELLPQPAPSQLKAELLVELPAREIAFLLSSYPDVVKTALAWHRPSGINFA